RASASLASVPVAAITGKDTSLSRSGPAVPLSLPPVSEGHANRRRQRMRKVIVSNSVTLDGRVDEVRDWALPGDDDEFVKHQTELLSHSDGLLLGSNTYEFFAAVWPSRSGEFPDRMNS